MSIQTNFPNIAPTLNLSFALTKQLDPRITFTRASEGRYYDGKTFAMAEQNLLLASEDAVQWTPAQLTVTANSTNAPNGTATADTLTEDTTTNFHRIQPLSVTFVSGLQYTFSVFAKDGDRNFVQLFLPAQFSISDYANFNVSTGALGTVGGGATATISFVGNGWYRCSITATATSSGSGALSVGLITASTSARAESYLGTSKFIYIWGAQLEQRSSVTAYTATTTQPITNYIPVLMTAASGVARFDSNPTTGESLGLLIEEQRTNLLTYSAQFDNAVWGPAAGTVTANATIAPDGTLTADRGVTNGTNFQVAQPATVSSGATITGSCFFKADGLSAVEIVLLANTNTTPYGRATFDVSTGVISVAASTANGGTNASAVITSVGNGWYRCAVTVTLPAVTAVGMRINAPGATGGIYIWGAQLEAGAFPTSYIPTVAAQVTRSADAASMTGSNFSSWYRPDAGTFVTEQQLYTLNSTTGAVFDANDGTTNNRIVYRLSGSGDQVAVRSGAATQAQGSTSVAVTSALRKVAVAYQADNFAWTANGSTVTTDMGGSIPTGVNQLLISYEIGPTIFSGHIRKIAFYPARLTNAQLQALTS